ncbi:MAG TPA: hypothetical protein VIK48_04395 [Candidatus Manganitrophaceae bacterium]
MSKKTRALLVGAGAVIFFAWGFRLYVLYLHWGRDPLMLPHILVAVISFGIGAFLLWMAARGSRASGRDYTVLIGAALFTLVWWGYRWVGVILHPERDPNPTAHLHLSTLFLVLGGLLLAVGWKGRKKK